MKETMYNTPEIKKLERKLKRACSPKCKDYTKFVDALSAYVDAVQAVATKK